MTDKIILIGGSAGSLDVLMYILPKLKKDLIIPIVIVLHRRNTNDSLLTDLLAAKTELSVREVEEKEYPLPGYIYIVPGDYHLLFEKDHSFTLDYSERVNYSRPSIDVVFQSAADAYAEGTICILLSGANADGTDGCVYVKEKGGTTVAQKPETAEVSFMPEKAILSNAIDHILTIEELATYINTI